jgi:hypothetical protein
VVANPASVLPEADSAKIDPLAIISTGAR